jgi:triphosphatase
MNTRSESGYFTETKNTAELPQHGPAERVYALSAEKKIPPVKGEPVCLSKHMALEQAFQEIVRNCLSQIQGNKQAVAEQKDAESLHQMRVGLRRLNSALDLFKDFIPLPDKLQQELRWLGKQLGEARDWDVLRLSTLPRVADAVQDKAWLRGIKAALAAKGEEKHTAASDAVKSSRYTRLMRNFSAWLQAEGWRDAIRPQARKQLAAPVPDAAQDFLSHAQRRLFKRGKKLDGATPKARHKVRIAAKKTRYAAEFFQSLFPKKAAKRYVKSLSSLQDELGHLNDMAVGERLLGDLTGEHRNLQAGTSFVRGYLSACREEGGQIENLWKKFKQADFLH